jgi:catalase
MNQSPVLTTESGAPVADNQNSQSAGPNGPLLLQDVHLLEKLARFNRERIPERIVHAVGIGAKGVFEVTHDLSRFTSAHFLGEVGRRTPLITRFSTVAGSKGAADTARDPRGFAVKLYTEEGNYDLVGNNTPVFFIKDPLKFPDFIHSQKPDPFTNTQEPDNVWDFFGLSPETTHQFTILFGDRGIPATVRHMNGYGSHTYSWTNAQGELFYVKYHWKTDQGIECLTSEEAAAIGGADPQFHNNDLRHAIERGDTPSWTLQVQVMPAADAPTYRFNPFDLTKVWPHADYPLIEVGRMTLDEVPENYFTEIEQVAFDPGNFVPGIGPSPDKMLQGRLFAYADAHRYRLGINHTQLPVNAPQRTTAHNYGRDGAMRFDTNGGREKNYEPNSFGGPVETGRALYAATAVTGSTGAHEPVSHAEDDDFVQAGALYRLMPADAQQRLVDNIAGSLARVSRADIVERAVANFTAADPEYGARVEARVKELRAQ